MEINLGMLVNTITCYALTFRAPYLYCISLIKVSSVQVLRLYTLSDEILGLMAEYRSDR